MCPLDLRPINEKKSGLTTIIEASFIPDILEKMLRTTRATNCVFALMGEFCTEDAIFLQTSTSPHL